MSIALIHEVHGEVRKLLIAGSEMTVDNFKLKKILPGMKKSGESVPVFARVADAIEAAINPGTGKSQERLLELTTIVSAIVYTQGETGIQGELDKVVCFGLSYPTDIPFRKLKPVISALTTKGSGRLEIIRRFFDSGDYKDLRLIVPLIEGLGDSYAEISDMVGNILKEYGEAVIPVLKKNMDINGGKRDARIVAIISDLCGKSEKEFYLNVIEKGSAEVKVSAAKALKDVPECEELLIELSEDKKKEVREAAFYALGKMKSGNAVKCLFKALRGKDRDITFEPIKVNKSQEIAKSLLEEGKKSLELIKASYKSVNKSDPPAKQEVDYFVTVLDCMFGKKDKDIFEFLKTCVDLSKNLIQFKLNNAEDTIIRTAARNILAFENEEAYQFLISSLNKYNNTIIEYSFEAAIRSKLPDYVFDNYSPMLKKGPKSFERNEIIKVMSYYCDFDEDYRIRDYYYPVRRDVIEGLNIKWDKRWAKLLFDLDEISLGCKLVSRGDVECINIMLEKLRKHSKFGDRCLTNIVLGLFQAGYERVRDEILNVLESNFNNNKHYLGYYLEDFIEVIKFLPASDAQYIDDFASKYNNKGVEKLLEVVWYLKNKK